jgi:CRISPR-associated protein Cas6
VLVTQNSSTHTSEVDVPHVELSFGVVGKTLPADQGYGLYSSIVHICPEVHNLQRISIQTITGFPDKQGKIYLSDHSRLRIRLPVDQIPIVYRLAGKSLKIGVHSIHLGIPKVFMLNPAPKLKARIVVIKGFQDPEPFLEAARRQLQALEITGTLNIPTHATGEVDRKVIKIKRYSVVGFGLEIADLNEEDSLKLQILGIGGKRKMGCGIFIPGGEL